MKQKTLQLLIYGFIIIVSSTSSCFAKCDLNICSACEKEVNAWVERSMNASPNMINNEKLWNAFVQERKEKLALCEGKDCTFDFNIGRCFEKKR